MNAITMFEDPEPIAPVKAPKGTQIYQCIVDLGDANRIATRQVLVDQTGLSYEIVDWHVKQLIERGMVRRVVNGVFEAVIDSPHDRAVSMTQLPGGTCKLEIGDICIDLTQRETRMIAVATGGTALLFGR